MTGNDTEILQIAATDGADAFEVYILPTRPISPSASSVNKLTFQHGILFYNSRPVRAVPLAEGLSQMISWLKPKVPCLLIAHNCKSFDAKHLIKALESTGVGKEFSAIVSGFSDTLPAFKELLPQRKSYSQENLVRDLLHCSYEAHNATSDVQSLYQLVNKFLDTKLLENIASPYHGSKSIMSALPRGMYFSEHSILYSTRRSFPLEWLPKLLSLGWDSSTCSWHFREEEQMGWSLC